jgi:hypothetical protein
MKTLTTLTIMIAALALGAGCKDKKDDKAGGAPAGDKGGGGDYAALTADPDPAAITPAETPPYESVVFQKTGKRGKTGWPMLNAWNLNTKPITFLAIHMYGYDKSGAQVARTSPPLSWNGKLEPGQKSSWEIDVAGMGDKVPASAVEFQVCYSGITLEGGEMQSDAARCPDQRPKT